MRLPMPLRQVSIPQLDQQGLGLQDYGRQLHTDIAVSCLSRKVEEAQTVRKEEAGKATVTTVKKLNDHVMIPSSDEQSPPSLHS